MKVFIKNEKIYFEEIVSAKIKIRNKDTIIIESIFDNKYSYSFNELIENRTLFSFLDEEEEKTFELIELEKSLVFNHYDNDQETKIYVYLTKTGNLAVRKAEQPQGNTGIKIKKFNYTSTEIKFKYKISKANVNEKIEKLLLIERETKEELEFNFFEDKKILKIRVTKLKNDGIYDVYTKVRIDSENTYLKRTSKYRFYKAIFLKNKIFNINGKAYTFNPYTTHGGSNFAIKFTKTTSEKIDLFRKNLKNKKDVWLIGENGYRAQDSGYAFFKYMRENYPEEKVFFVIKKESLDYEKVSRLGNIIDFGSKAHYKIMGSVKYLVSTHHAEYLFPTESKKIVNKIKAKRIFLQHGVLGLKKMSSFYNKYNPEFKTDMFVVSGDREKEIVVAEFEYDKKDVKITGLARFDTLFTKEKINDTILIVPTWRAWLRSGTDIKNTEYFEAYYSLVKNLQKKKYTVVFILHINMKKFKENFIDLGVEVYSADEIDLQNYLKSSKLLITDYSSVAFDFAFLEKPVILYQFDKNRMYRGSQQPYYDIEEDLPFYSVSLEEEIFAIIESLEETEYKLSQEFTARLAGFVKYQDANNSKRIYETIIQEEYGVKHKFFKGIFFQKGYNFFRRSKLYYPMIKLMYNFLRYLPKKNTVLIESTFGKSISDSPKEIMDEWIKEDPNKEFIIVYNQALPVKYKNYAKSIKRLTPSYFYYLARSKYWINNQNFPYYIKNHKTIYLQTWHGTPIKKMLNDLEFVVGRDDGYISRINQANDQWTYLLSPNNYATKAFETAFDHKAKVLEYGYPRNDLFFDQKRVESIKNKLYKKYSLDKNKKIILFSPTFRDDGVKIRGKFIQDLKIDYDKMFKVLSDNDSILLIKLHNLGQASQRIPSEYYSRIKDVSLYPEINDLFLISDILITDYSSVMFDYLIMNKKIILYAHDLEEYQFNNRGFYLDYKKEAPGIIIQDFDQLVKEIQDDQVPENFLELAEKYIVNKKGDASKKTVEFLRSLD